MSVKAIRRIVLLVCAGGIAGMIASSVAANTGAALTFGLLTAAAVLCAMVATAVTSGGRTRDTSAMDEAQAAKVERLVRQLIEQGAGEAQVRSLVAESVRLARGAKARRAGTPDD